MSDCQKCRYSTNPSGATGDYCLNRCEHGFETVEGCKSMLKLTRTVSSPVKAAARACVLCVGVFFTVVMAASASGCNRLKQCIRIWSCGMLLFD